jgi:hypothetical protein
VTATADTNSPISRFVIVKGAGARAHPRKDGLTESRPKRTPQRPLGRFLELVQRVAAVDIPLKASFCMPAPVAAM